MTVLPKRVIHLSSCKYLTKQGVRISLLSFQPKDISLGQNGLGGYDINVKMEQRMKLNYVFGFLALFFSASSLADKYEQYIGQWLQENSKSPVVYEISRDGDTFLLNRDALQVDPYSKKKPSALKKQDGQLVYFNEPFGLSSDGKKLYAENREFKNISSSEFEALKSNINKIRSEKNIEVGQCNNLRNEYNTRKGALEKMDISATEKSKKRSEMNNEFKKKQAEIPHCLIAVFF